MFPLMHEADRHHPKTMVVGARTADRSVYFVLSELQERRVQATDAFLAVYDPDLDTGHIYLRNGRSDDVTHVAGGMYELGGECYRPADLPLEKAIPVAAFFFAWQAFYPASEFPG